ncbi:Increased DNA methylation 1, partial [Linum grandiflorum]
PGWNLSRDTNNLPTSDGWPYNYTYDHFAGKEKRRRSTTAQLIPLHQKVEVRREEEGFSGPWKQATVVALRRERCQVKYSVKYDHMLVDDKSDFLDGSVHVSLSVDDDDDIRPMPPELECNEWILPCGLCVDVKYNESWWEGVIFDHEDGSGERIVFFPDLSDEMLVPLDAMRISQDWDRFSGEWKRRGMWLFLELVSEYEQEHCLPASVQQLWDDLQSKEGFKKLGKWSNSSSRTMWEDLLLNTIEDNLEVVLNYLFQEMSLPQGISNLLVFTKSVSNPSTAKGGLSETHDPVLNRKTASSPPKNDGLIKSVPVSNTHCLENGDSVLPPASLGSSSFFILDEAISRSSPQKFTISFANSPGIESSWTPTENYGSRVCTQSDDDLYVHVEPKYWPQAIVDWYIFCGDKWFKTTEPSRGGNYQLLAKRARSHLAAVGWRFVSTLCNGQRRMKHISPTGKSYDSLRKSCEVCMEHSGIDVPSEPIKLHNVDKRQGTHRVGLQHPSSQSLSTKLKSNGGVAQPKHLRPSDKVQNNIHVPKPSHRNPRTVLSWLLENNVVSPRTKVYYYRSALGDSSTVEGRITRDGIKCSCCKMVYSLSKFQQHVGGKCISNYRREPASNIFLKDGRSLLDCQLQIMHDAKLRDLRNLRMGQVGTLREQKQEENDCVCSVCRYGGDLIMCDLCPSSFHPSCLDLAVIPDGDWFCPSCCCRICSKRGSENISEWTVDEHMLDCAQCEHKYHISCLRNKGIDDLEHHPKTNWFCSSNCKSISRSLTALLGKSIPVGVENLSWTMLKLVESDSNRFGGSLSTEIQAQSYSKLNIALQVMHECFDPLEEPHTKRDIIREIIFSKRSELRRLDFSGFYTVILEKDDEVISVAALRVFGEEVAEVPLIGTGLQHRRCGLCRILMNVIEKKLVELGVQRLVVPAVPSLLNKWTGSFGFSRMTKDERILLVDCTLVEFEETIMCHKQLTAAPSGSEIEEVAQTPICTISDDEDDLGCRLLSLKSFKKIKLAKK